MDIKSQTLEADIIYVFFRLLQRKIQIYSYNIVFFLFHFIKAFMGKCR